MVGCGLSSRGRGWPAHNNRHQTEHDAHGAEVGPAQAVAEHERRQRGAHRRDQRRVEADGAGRHEPSGVELQVTSYELQVTRYKRLTVLAGTSRFA